VNHTFASDSVTRITRLTWLRSIDELSGERDVERYVVWRRTAAVADWGDPYVVLPGGDSLYVYNDASVTSGDSLYYAVSAQDCTPSLSSQRTSSLVVIP